ncbi:MAG: hypothetical protein K1X94_05980 [Sandaracinaceae bacterium]|nr:hypothetical protein [Sandaracinaceae bacterium]
MSGAPGDKAQSAAPRTSGWLRALGIGCGFVAFGGLCVVGLSTRMILAQTSDAADACSGFLGDVRDDDHASALQRMDADYQHDLAAAHLRDEIARISPLESHVQAIITSVESRNEGDASTVEGSLYGSFGEVPVACELSQRDGYWYIDLVVVDGTPLE